MFKSPIKWPKLIMCLKTKTKESSHILISFLTFKNKKYEKKSNIYYFCIHFICSLPE